MANRYVFQNSVESFKRIADLLDRYDRWAKVVKAIDEYNVPHTLVQEVRAETVREGLYLMGEIDRLKKELTTVS